MTLQNKAFGIPDHIMRRPANVARVGFEHVFAHATIENWLVLKKWQSAQIRCWISVAVGLSLASEKRSCRVSFKRLT